MKRGRGSHAYFKDKVRISFLENSYAREIAKAYYRDGRLSGTYHRGAGNGGEGGGNCQWGLPLSPTFSRNKTLFLKIYIII